jgi:protein-arginine kinase activator protein McsA
MICEECNKEIATVHITSMGNGKVMTENLCATCAEPRLNSKVGPPQLSNWMSGEAPEHNAGE